MAIYDAYAKSKVHLLLLPKRDQKEGVKQLTEKDLQLLEEMDARARWICSGFSHLVDSHGVRIPMLVGFHAEPSLNLLHLHILSSDLDSPALKNKKHFNSFGTKFFVTIREMKDMIKLASRGAAAAAQGATKNFFASSQASHQAQAQGSAMSLASQLALRVKHLTSELRCHHVSCSLRCNNIPELKKHLAMCKKPYPSTP